MDSLNFDNLVIGYKYDVVDSVGNVFQLYYTGRYGDALGPVMTFSLFLKDFDNYIEEYHSEFFKKYKVFELNTVNIYDSMDSIPL